MNSLVPQFFQNEIFAVKLSHLLIFFGSWLVLGILQSLYSWFTQPGLEIKSRHFLITGASEGLGLETARILHEKGAILSLVSRSKSKLEAAKQSIQSDSKRIHIFPCDVTDEAKTLSMISSVQSTVGPIDNLFLIAGISLPGLVENVPMSEYRFQMELNLFAKIRIVKALLPYFKRRNSGRIVFVSSILGFMTFAGYSAYSCSKYAQVAFFEALKNELAHTRVKVHMLVPGTIKSPGFEIEEARKPSITKDLEGTTSSFTPNQVATKLLSSLKKGHSLIPDRFEMKLFLGPVLGFRNRITPVADLFFSPFYVIFGSITRIVLDYSVRSFYKKQSQKSE